MANQINKSEQQTTATSSDTVELVGSEAVIGKARKRTLPKDWSDEPSTQDLLRQLIRRFDKHEVAVRADIASLKTVIMEELVANVSNCIIRQEEQIDHLRRDVLDLTDGLSVQNTNIHTLRDSIHDGFAALRTSTTILQGDICALRRTLDDRLPNQISNAFPQFRSLPAEIRCMVWEWATTGRILEIHELEREEPLNRGRFREFEFIGNRYPPATAHVCRESRNVACRDGKLISLENHRFQVNNGQSNISTTYKKQWAWFNSYKDTLYLNTRCSTFHNGYVGLLKNVRHFILRPTIYEQLSELLEPGVCPHLTSIQLTFGLLEWPVRQDLEFEGSLWGDGSHHVAVQIMDGDTDEATRAYDNLRKLLSPRCGNEARTSLRRLFTASGGSGVDFDDYATRERPGRRLEKLLEMSERSMLSRVWMLSLVPEDRQGGVRLCEGWIYEE
ncbi:hypothetical protein E0Z10_g9097 [Xylaria hypoxylon]|uniref:2EXR domain-containing protein n=1 Tax=Xylaria hypoxylon TaxID=37992 RepID=A0A4Z0YI50_9PEZI|nr:hypothetical protein E0Z10_g9097 [Xylaria hypoxylon]